MGGTFPAHGDQFFGLIEFLHVEKFAVFQGDLHGIVEDLHIWQVAKSGFVGLRGADFCDVVRKGFQLGFQCLARFIRHFHPWRWHGAHFIGAVVAWAIGSQCHRHQQKQAGCAEEAGEAHRGILRRKREEGARKKPDPCRIGLRQFSKTESRYHRVQPLRYSKCRKALASGRLVMRMALPSHKIFLPARIATLPSRTASVSTPA